MTVFLIILAVIVVLIVAILSLSATVTLVYDNGWKTRIKVLFIEKDIQISKILSMLLFPEKTAQEAADKMNEEKVEKQEKKEEKPKEEEPKDVSSQPAEEKKPDAKSNPIKKLWETEGLVGIMSLLSNVLQSANSAIITLIRGLHIYSLYVMIISGGGDAADIAIKHGNICSYYYPLKGLILSIMKVDNFDEYIQPDFIAPDTVFEFQFIGSISVGLLAKVGLKAGFVFIKNLIINKKGDK